MRQSSTAPVLSQVSQRGPRGLQSNVNLGVGELQPNYSERGENPQMNTQFLHSTPRFPAATIVAGEHVLKTTLENPAF